MAVGVVTITPIDLWWTEYLTPTPTETKGEVLVVLGGSMIGSGILGVSSYWRSVYALWAYREGGFQTIIVSGGGESGPAAAMKQFLVAEGVPEAVIEVEKRSSDTRTNALYVKELLAGDSRRVVLMTSDYHMYRAQTAFTKAGLSVLALPIPDIAKRSNDPARRWDLFLELVEEMGKIAYYRLRGWN